MDGQLKVSVKACDRTKALLEKVDTSKVSMPLLCCQYRLRNKSFVNGCDAIVLHFVIYFTIPYFIFISVQEYQKLTNGKHQRISWFFYFKRG